MRRLLYLAALAMVASLVLAPAAFAQVRGPSGGDGTYNCDSFDTQEQAQAFYNADPSDPNDLDADGDGIPCETTPSSVTEDGTIMGGIENDPSEFGDLDCVDFAVTATETSAQAVYDADPSDPNGLDRDGDGIACESSFSEASGTRFEDGSGMIEGTGGGPAPGGDTGVAAGQYANDAADNSVTTLPDTSGPGSTLLLPVAGLLLATGLTGLKVVRRRP
ncbi:MAG: excalibur calcium-binding domain-containing protein [Rubrobacteraceae bacterium]